MSCGKHWHRVFQVCTTLALTAILREYIFMEVTIASPMSRSYAYQYCTTRRYIRIVAVVKNSLVMHIVCTNETNRNQVHCIQR